MTFRWFLGATALVVILLSTACDPYGSRLKGEFNAGAADPFNFPPAYRGTGFTRQVSGSGSFTERRAFVNDVQRGYFFFPYSPTQMSTYGYAPVTRTGDAPRTYLPRSSVPTPVAYVFDPQTTGTSVLRPIGAAGQCRTPWAGYTYDAQLDGIHYDEQGTIFAALPDQGTSGYVSGALPSWSYVPVVRMVSVTSNGETCQDIKSEQTLRTRSDVAFTPAASPATTDTLLAFAIIDPGSPVYRVGQTSSSSTGVTIQRWGWFNRFLVAYIDGGQIPLEPGTAGATRMKANRLFFPANSYQVGAATVPGGLGNGGDILEFARNDPNYSPICQVFSYANTGGPLGGPGTPTNAAAAIALGITPVPATPPTSATAPQPFIFCLQAQ